MAYFNRDYKKKYESAEKQRKLAWGKYFSLLEENWSLNTTIVEQVDEVIGDDTDFNENHNETNAHLMKFIRELYQESKKKITCPICLDKIEDTNNLDTTKCGHNFHSDCLDGVKNAHNLDRFFECPLCRSKCWNNKKV